MKTLYPEIEPVAIHNLSVGVPHILYVEECGNPKGIPVLFLHGGPGSGCKPYHRQFFSPNHYRIILFDQRGAGRSSPPGEISNNDTQVLIDDMEWIREKLAIDNWVLFGGSWGATLALLYAQRHPDRVLGMILRGTFLARQRDLDWFFKDGAKRIFPDSWEQFSRLIPAHKRHDPVAAYHKRLQSENAEARLLAAHAWARWARVVVTYTLPEEGATADEDSREQQFNEALIQCHYAKNQYFLTCNQILTNVQQLPKVPTTIIHGRRDLTCTLESSWAVHCALPHSRLVILADAGHLAGEPTMIDALVTTTDDMLNYVS